jgi:hypothetical protein
VTARKPAGTVAPMDRVRWARRIASLRAADPPVTWAEVSREIGLSQSQCKRILAQHRAAGDPDAPADPWAPIQRHIDVLEVALDLASETYAAAPPGSSVRVGAIRQMMEASERMLDVMRTVGLLPRDLRAMSVEREVRQLFLDLAEVLREHDVPDEVVQKMVALSERRIVQPAQLRQAG